MDVSVLIERIRTGRARVTAQDSVTLSPAPSAALVEKLQNLYEWLSTRALACPCVDLEFGDPQTLGQGRSRLVLRRQRSYASFLLLPLLTLLTRRRLLFVGAPGRGKTTVAVLMGMLVGHDRATMQSCVQHGHPQLTIADLLGSPLPGELVKARSTAQVHVAWRRWISMPVKVIDEYNRIPTKTQSALLSLMSEGYAEMFEQTVHTGPSAWFLTANDDQGGGTFPVIEALRDRIDVVVRCPPFPSAGIGGLVERVSGSPGPDEAIPSDLILSSTELDEADRRIRAVPVPPRVQRVLGFLASQLEFCQRASTRLELQSKDSLHIAGKRLAHVCNEECPLDKLENLCTQCEQGLSGRVLQTVIHYAKALAFFRGEESVTSEDLRELLPWVLHDKLHPNPASPFFQLPENRPLLADRVSWIAQLFEKASSQLTGHMTARAEMERLREWLDECPETLDPPVLRERLQTVEAAAERILEGHELNGPSHDDLVVLKALHSRYTLQLRRKGVSAA